MQKKQIVNPVSAADFDDSVRARIAGSFRRAYKAMDKRRDTIDTVLEVVGGAIDVLAMFFGIDPTGVSLIIELIKFVWELSGSPRVRAAACATIGWLRRLLRRASAAVHRIRTQRRLRARAYRFAHRLITRH